MNIHLICLVGGPTYTLDAMLAHYQRLGITSFFIHIHAKGEDDPWIARIRAVLARHGLRETTLFLDSYHRHQRTLYERPRLDRPDDWFVLADHDELHEYPDSLEAVVDAAERAGATQVRGLLVDRLGEDGTLPAIDEQRPLAEQFPLASFLTRALLGGDARKVVMVKGGIRLSKGQHDALNSRPLDGLRWMVPVHHYKWSADVVPRLRVRMEELRAEKRPHWNESMRALHHLEAHGGRFDIDNPRFLVDRASPRWPYWNDVVAWYEQRYRAGTQAFTSLRT